METTSSADVQVRTRRHGAIFYGWWIVAGGAVLSALSGGLNFYGFSALFVPLSQEFGWSRTVLSGVFALSRLEGGILGPAEGYLADKYGPRRIMLVGIPLLGLGFILLSQVNSLLSLYIIYITAITIGSALGTFTPVSAAVANWFDKKRSRAFGFVMSGTGLGGAIFLPILGWWISTFGWRHAVVASGVLILAIGLPISLIMRHKPEQYGLLPDGAEPASPSDHTTVKDEAEEAQPLPQEASEFGPVQSLKTSTFWLLGASQALRSVVTTGFTIHFVAMMVDRDISLTMATSLLGSVALISLIGRIGLAWMGDLVNKQYLLAGAAGVMALSMIGMSQAQDLWQVAVILVVYSVAYGGSVVLPMGLQADYFGRHAYATIRGLLHTVQTGGMIFGPVFAGLVYDFTESYFFAFLGFGLAAGLAALFLLLLRRPTLPVEEGRVAVPSE